MAPVLPGSLAFVDLGGYVVILQQVPSDLKTRLTDILNGTPGSKKTGPSHFHVPTIDGFRPADAVATRHARLVVRSALRRMDAVCRIRQLAPEPWPVLALAAFAPVVFLKTRREA